MPYNDDLSALEARATLCRAGAPGRQVAWRRFGSGPALVLLHGGHGSWLHWVRNAEALATAHTVWVPDMPGYGDSDAPAEPLLQDLLQVLIASFDEAAGTGVPLALAGFSFGGLVAAHWAAARPSVKALTLLGPAGHGTARRPRAELLPWRDALQRQDSAALQDTMRHNLAAHMLHAPQAIDALALQLHTQACLRTRFRSKPISRAAGLANALQAYAGPLLCIWGEHDVTTTPGAARALHCEGRTGCGSLIVPGAGHWVQYEAADAVNARLLEFLGAAADRRYPPGA